MILWLTSRFRHAESGREDCRLVVIWYGDRLVIKEWDAVGTNGAHIFPTDKMIGASANECPAIIAMEVGPGGVGCVVSGKTADGEIFIIKSETADFVRHKFLTFDKPIKT